MTDRKYKTLLTLILSGGFAFFYAMLSTLYTMEEASIPRVMALTLLLFIAVRTVLERRDVR